jgi:hypothetical protein
MDMDYKQTVVPVLVHAQLVKNKSGNTQTNA